MNPLCCRCQPQKQVPVEDIRCELCNACRKDMGLIRIPLAEQIEGTEQ